MNIDLGKYKKIYLGVGFILAVALIGFTLYSVFFKPTTPPPAEEQEATSTPEGLPEAEEGEGRTYKPDSEGHIPGDGETQPGQEPEESDQAAGQERRETVTTVNNSPSSHTTLSSDGNGVQFYNKDNGKFYRVNNNGEIEALSDKVFNDVENVYWAPDKNKAVIEYPDGSNMVYDFEQEEQTTLPKHWEDFEFSPQGDELVFKSMGMSPENRWLAISDDKGSDSQSLEEIGENADKVHTSWSPNDQIVAIHTEGKDFNRQKVYFIGKNNENFRSMTIPGRGFEPKWSQEGDQLLYSVYSEQSDLKPQLWTVSAEPGNIGERRKSLDVNTWAHKCAFTTNDEAYCGVPEDLERGSGLFQQKAQDAADDIYRINTKTGEKELMADPEENYNMSNISVSKDGNSLFFTDKNTQKVHKIDLNQ